MEEKIIRVREIVPGCMPEAIEVGDWIDLKTSIDVDLKNGDYGFIPLGVAMELPEGYEAHVAPRSSTFNRWGLVMANSIGIIDNTYCGDDDEWMFPFICLEDVEIPAGTRIAQFRIVENQPPVKMIKVDILGNDNRGGIGSTGV